MALKVLPASVERLAWQEPPPCEAEPSMVNDCEDPAAQVATELPATLPLARSERKPLQAKSEPVSERGLVMLYSGLVTKLLCLLRRGGGSDISMWAKDVVAIVAKKKVVKKDFMLKVL